MKFVTNIQICAIYLFVFSLNFETASFFNFGIDYLASKITVSILILVSLLNYKSLLYFKPNSKFLFPLILYFTLLTVVSFVNINVESKVIFYFEFFLNIIIFTILINYAQKSPDTMLKGLLVFAISTFIIALLSIAGVGVTEELRGLEGRATVFGMNQNMLGVSACVSLFVITSIVIDNKLIRGTRRFLLLLLVPFLFMLMISTGSRLAFISFIFGISAFVFFKKATISAKKILLIAISFLTFIVLWQVYLKNTLVAERLFGSIREGDLSSRDLIWLPIIGIISDNYTWGVGMTGYAKEMGNYFGEGVVSPHNVLIEVTCYTGIVGLSIFLVFIYRIVKVAYSRQRYQNELLPIVVVVPILGMILSGQILEQKIIWVLFAFIVGSTVTKYNTHKVLRKVGNNVVKKD